MSNFRFDGDGAGDGLRRFVPAATIILSLLLMTLPLPLAWGVMPQLALLFLIIWSSIQPRLIPAWAAFLLGLLADFLFGLPMGVWAVLFPAVAIVVRMAETRVEGHSLAIDWAFAALLLVAAQILAWQILGFVGLAPAFWPMLAQALLSILAYPLAASIAARIQRRLIDAGA